MNSFSVDAALTDDPRVMNAGPLGLALHLRALAYSARHGTAGFIPRKALRLLTAGFESVGLASRQDDDRADFEPADAIDWRHEMVAAGLWDSVDGGWRILEQPRLDMPTIPNVELIDWPGDARDWRRALPARREGYAFVGEFNLTEAESGRALSTGDLVLEVQALEDELGNGFCDGVRVRIWRRRPACEMPPATAVQEVTRSAEPPDLQRPAKAGLTHADAAKRRPAPVKAG